MLFYHVDNTSFLYYPTPVRKYVPLHDILSKSFLSKTFLGKCARSLILKLRTIATIQLLVKSLPLSHWHELLTQILFLNICSNIGIYSPAVYMVGASSFYSIEPSLYNIVEP